MLYYNHRSEPYFTFLKNGQKTIEGRLRKGKYSKIKPGDEIVVYNEGETDNVKTLVKRIARYQSIREIISMNMLYGDMVDQVNSRSWVVGHCFAFLIQPRNDTGLVRPARQIN